ncbi:MAG: hypothetical protein ACOYOB_14070 [Myxococcota bacterium]
MKNWWIGLMIVAVAACNREKPAEPTPAPAPAAPAPEAVAPPAEASPAAPAPVMPAAVAPVAAVPVAPTDPAKLHPDGRGDGKGKLDQLPDEAPPATIPTPDGFADDCAKDGKCKGNLVCFEFGDGSKHCTMKCKTHEECPAGKYRSGCNGQGYCRHGATPPD